MVTFFHPCFYVHLLTNDAPFFFQNFKVTRFLNISGVEDIKKRDDAFFFADIISWARVIIPNVIYIYTVSCFKCTIYSDSYIYSRR